MGSSVCALSLFEESVVRYAALVVYVLMPVLMTLVSLKPLDNGRTNDAQCAREVVVISCCWRMQFCGTERPRSEYNCAENPIEASFTAQSNGSEIQLT
jgi:hypothetical protein